MAIDRDTDALEGDIAFLDSVRAGEDAAARKAQTPKRLGIEPGDRILELGPGTGEDLRRLVDAAGSEGFGVGVEILEGMAREAAERVGGENVAFVVADARSLPIRDGVIDRVNVERVLQHVPEVKRAVAETFRALRPGGRLLAFEPDQDLRAVDHPDRATEAQLRQRNGSRFENPTIGRRLYGLLVKAGFRLESVHGLVSHWENADIVDALSDAASVAADEGAITAERAADFATTAASMHAAGRLFSIWVAFEVLATKPAQGS